MMFTEDSILGNTFKIRMSQDRISNSKKLVTYNVA